MSEIKQKMQEVLDSLSNTCLKLSEDHIEYNSNDLVNASLIFIHVASSVLYANGQDKNLSLPQMVSEMEDFGKAFRELIKEKTGIDFHNAVNDYKYDVLNERTVINE